MSELDKLFKVIRWVIIIALVLFLSNYLLQLFLSFLVFDFFSNL